MSRKLLLNGTVILAVADNDGQFDIVCTGAVVKTVASLPDDFVLGKYFYSNNSFVLNGDWVDPTPLPARRLIAKSVVQERVNSIGKLGAVFSALNSQPILFARWFAPDWPNVYADDEGMIALLKAVSCTDEQIATITAE